MCRFAAADVAEDLVTAGAADLADYFSASLEPEDVEDVAGRLHGVSLDGLDDADLVDRLRLLLRNLDRLVEAGAGLTDRYSDDVD